MNSHAHSSVKFAKVSYFDCDHFFPPLPANFLYLHFTFVAPEIGVALGILEIQFVENCIRDTFQFGLVRYNFWFLVTATYASYCLLCLCMNGYQE